MLKRLSPTPFFLVLNLIFSPVGHAALDIEGGTEKAVSDYQTLLKSVIKLNTGFFFSQATCSATLVGPNILLTAYHCVAPTEEKDHYQLKSGDPITLNDNPAYEIVNVVAPPAISAKIGDRNISTDIALIHFKAKSCSRSTLANIKPLSMSTAENQNRLSQKILIAGYGNTTASSSDAGTLHAGVTSWVHSDYGTAPTVGTNPFFDTAKLAKLAQIPEEALFSVADRTSMIGFDNKPGSSISSAITGVTQEKEASIQEGDSGGPAFAFDSAGNAFIVGVASLAAPQISPNQGMIFAIDPDLKSPLVMIKPETKHDNSSDADQMRYYMWKIVAKVTELGYLDDLYTVLKHFIVMVVTPRTQMSEHASLQNEINRKFISEGMEKLKKDQDLRQFCQ